VSLLAGGSAVVCCLGRSGSTSAAAAGLSGGLLAEGAELRLSIGG
jgi:hypothetical protein